MLDAMIELAVELASCGLDDLRTIAAAFPGASMTAAGGHWTKPGRARVTIPTDRGDIDVVTLLKGTERISLRIAHELGPRRFLIELPSGDLAPLSRDLAPYAAALGDATVVGDEKHFRVAISDLGRAEAAVKLLVALCRTPTSGAFR